MKYVKKIDKISTIYLYSIMVFVHNYDFELSTGLYGIIFEENKNDTIIPF